MEENSTDIVSYGEPQSDHSDQIIIPSGQALRAGELEERFGKKVHGIGRRITSRLQKWRVGELFERLHHAKLLHQAHTELCKRGPDSEFGEFVATYTDYERATADRMRRTWAAFEEHIEAAGGVNKLPDHWGNFCLSGLYELAKGAVPDDVRTKAIEVAEAGEQVTRDVVKRLMSPAPHNGNGAVSADLVVDAEFSATTNQSEITAAEADVNPVSEVLSDIQGEDIHTSILRHSARRAKYRAIVADPPWVFKNRSSRAAAENHYSTMAIEEICELPVGDLAEDDCFLHLWVPHTHLLEAFQVLDAWGFQYASQSVWCKPSIGLGNYWRMSHELCLLAKKGSPKFIDDSFGSWFEAPRTKHSAKPTDFRDRVEAVNDGPYLELFARGEAPDGWTFIGNQAVPADADRLAS